MPSRLASLIRQQIGAPADLPLDPELVAGVLGYTVVWVSPAELGAARGFALLDEIHVARTADPTQDRWTLAHELAHAEARRHGMDWRDERLANACAAELLMPAAALRPWIADDLDLPAIAEVCGTSIEATARRAIELRPGYVSIVSELSERAYSTLGRSRRIAAVAHGLAQRCRREGRSDRIRLPSWVARGWAVPDDAAGIAVILRG